MISAFPARYARVNQWFMFATILGNKHILLFKIGRKLVELRTHFVVSYAWKKITLIDKTKNQSYFDNYRQQISDNITFIVLNREAVVFV